MKNSILLSRAGATAAAIPGACLPARARVGVPIGVLAYVLLGAFACPATAFTPSSKAGGENTPLNLSSTSTGSSHAPGSGGASIVRTIVGLAIVIAVIWGLAWILRQVKASKGGVGTDQSSEGLSSVAALTLGSGRSVHLVRAGSDYVLLGSTEHGVAPIHRYTEEEAQEAGLLLQERSPERPRLIGAAGALVAGATRAVAHAGYSERSAFSEDEDGGVGEWPHAGARGTYVSPVAGRRPDPMRMSSKPSGLIDRLRQMTVRR
jgi:flagellar protein FliO/FliZ